MPLSTCCPHCDASYQLTDEADGRPVRCTRCRRVFTVVAGATPTEPLVLRPIEPTDMALEPVVLPPSRPAAPTADVVRGRRVVKKADAGSGSLLAVLLAGGAAAGVVLLVVCGGGLWFLLRDQPPAKVGGPVAVQAPPVAADNPPPRLEVPNEPWNQNPPPRNVFIAPDGGVPQQKIQLPPELQAPPGIQPPPNVVQMAPGQDFQFLLPWAEQMPPGQVDFRLGPSKPAKPLVYQPHVPADREEVKLSGTVSDVAVGGGGRYLILRLAGKRKLAVFDVQQGKVAKELPLLEEVVHFAVGAEQLIVVYPNTRLIHYWSLATLERERSEKLPDNLSRDNIHQIAMGSASLGPLFVYLPREKRTMAMDPKSLQTMEIHWRHWAPNNAYGPLNMRVAADGSQLVGWGGGWAGLGVATFADGRQTGTNEKYEAQDGSGAYALPGPDSRLLYSPCGLSDHTLTWARIPELKGAFLLPAVEPGYFLAVAGQGDVGNQPLNAQTAGELSFYNEDRRRLFVLRGLDELKARSELPWEKRIFFYPRAGLLVTMGDSGDHLILRHVDLLAELDRSGTDYLIVLSRPPAAKAGQPYSYPLDVRAKKGGVKVKLERGPDGLKVTPEGRVSWTVPPKFDQPSADAMVTLGDASGQEVAHTFRIHVER